MRLPDDLGLSRKGTPAVRAAIDSIALLNRTSLHRRPRQ